MDCKELKRLLATVPGSPMVMASGAMVLRGLISEAADLDLVVTPEEFQALVAMPGSRVVPKRFGPCVQVGDIEASTYNCLAEHGRQLSWDMIDGVRVQSIASLRDLYLSLNRPKDQHKLRLLGL
jgi:hypothetical protein